MFSIQCFDTAGERKGIRPEKSGTGIPPTVLFRGPGLNWSELQKK